MTDTLWRLAWALPLVLVTGMAAVLTLRRFVVPAQGPGQQAQRLRLQQSLSLSDETRVHMIEVDRQVFLIVESSRQALLQSTSSASEAVRAPIRLGASWMQRICKTDPR
jgi:flagellar biogenesis protein FliO